MVEEGMWEGDGQVLARAQFSGGTRTDLLLSLIKLLVFLLVVPLIVVVPC